MVTPNLISGTSLVFGLIAGPLILFHRLGLGLVFVSISLVLDGLDGPMARHFSYDLKKGETLDTIIDRTLEIVTFLSLVVGGYADYMIVVLSIVAILLMTSLRKKTGFDPGFKRIVLFFGYLTNFYLAFTIIFWANILGFIVNLLILDIRDQRKLDSCTP